MRSLAAAASHGGGGAFITISVTWIVVSALVTALVGSAWKLLPWMIKQALDEKIDSKLVPMMDSVHVEMSKVHERIDTHMDNEENSFDALNETVGALSVQLGARDELFDGIQAALDGAQGTLEQTRHVLEEHMSNDEQQFALSAEALVEGQRTLIERLAVIEANTSPQAGR